MTPDLIELSKKAAEVLGVPVYRPNPNGITRDMVWLAEDSGRCADIAADRLINTEFVEGYAMAWWWKQGAGYTAHASYADHNNERLKAYCVAVLKAVIEQGKQ